MESVMGGKYSKVMHPSFPSLKKLEGLSIIDIRACIVSIAKSTHKSGLYFLTKNEVSWTFDWLNEVQLYHILSLFDVSQNGNIPSLDFWGSLILLSADGNNDKVNHCFKMMDLNDDEHLSFNDLVVVMTCATRGVAKLRGYALMPTDYIEKIVIEAFRVCKKTLNEEGEISLLDFRTVLLADDLVGQYMASLGVPVVEVDAAALVTKRSNLLKEAMALRAKIAETVCALEECQELEEQLEHERGGDVALVRVSDEELLEASQLHVRAKALELLNKQTETELLQSEILGQPAATSTVANVAVVWINPAPESSRVAPSTQHRPGSSTGNSVAVLPNTPSAAVLQRNNNRAASANAAATSKVVSKINSISAARPVAEDPTHPSRRFLKCDNSVFADADMTADKKGSKGYYGEGFRSSLLEVWRKLPQDDDLMVELDVYTIIALFDNVTVVLTYSDAVHCLQHLPISCIGRYNFEDVLRWFLLYGIDLSAKAARDSAIVAASNSSTANSTAQAAKPGNVNRQLHLLPPVDDWSAFTHSCRTQYTAYCRFLNIVQEKAGYLRSVLDRVDTLVPNTSLKYPNYLHPERSAAATTPSRASKPAVQSGAGKEMGYMMKLVEFRKITSRKPSTLQLKYVFNHPNVKVLPRSTTPLAGHSADGAAGRGRAQVKPTSRGKSRSRSRGKSPGKSDAEDARLSSAVPSSNAHSHANATSHAGGEHSKVNLHQYVSEEETLPPTKTIKVEEIPPEDWKLHFKLSLTCNPFTNLSTKRSKESSRLRSMQGRHFIEDFSNLQAQDLLDYYNLQQEQVLLESLQVEARLASGGDSELTTLLGAAGKKAAAKNAKVFNSVSWLCLQLKQNTTIEQERLLVEVVKNFLLSVPFHVREHLYSEIWVQVFTVFKTDGSGGASKSSVAGKFLSSLTGKGDDVAEADAMFLAAPKVLLVALFHETDHFAELEKKLVGSDVFLTRAVTSASVEVQLMQSFDELLAHASKYAQYGEKLFGPQEEELGEDLMNPLKFAKEMRTRRNKLTELAQTAANMSRAELVQQCRRLGMKDSGTVAELMKRVQEGCSAEADLTGYGELSKFGEAMIAKIFHLFKVHPIAKSDEDGGLGLWEFNRLLHQIEAPALYDVAEYQRLMKELQLLTDRDQRLRLHGLLSYYRHNGRLKAENDLLGVGSLDHHLSGKFSISSTFEPDALASVLNLVGNNTLFIPELLQLLVRFSTLKDVKMEAELDKLSEFFALFNTNTGLSFNRTVLRNPGWLSRAVEGLSSFLSDGDSGVIPALRKMAQEQYGTYFDWEAEFRENIVQRIQRARNENAKIKELRSLWANQDARLARRAQRAEEEALRQQMMLAVESGGPPPPALRNSTKTTKDPRFGSPGGSLSGQDDISSLGSGIRSAGSKAAVITPQPVLKHTALRASNDGEEDEDEDDEAAEWVLQPAGDDEGSEAESDGEEVIVVVDYAALIDAELEQDLVDAISAALPPLTDNKLNLPAWILQLKEDLVFLYSVRFKTDLELTLEESNAIFERKELLVQKIEQAQAMLQENERLLAAHSCALYDAVRVFGVGLGSIGTGTRDFCLRGYADGFDFVPHLPAGNGELAPEKLVYVEKAERAAHRKASALAALERERRRRNMTEEEKEAMHREQYLRQLKAWKQEEALMFAHAYAALSDARAERKSTAELIQMASLWEALVVAKEQRYPNDVITAVCQNDLACILLEFFGSRHPRGSPGQYLLESAVTIVTTIIDGLEAEIQDLAEKAEFGYSSKAHSPTKPDASKRSTSSLKVDKTAALPPVAIDPVVDPHVALQQVLLPGMLVIVNYITVLIETESTGKLQQALQLKRRLYDAYHHVSDAQREKLAQGVVPAVKEIPVFPYAQPQGQPTRGAAQGQGQVRSTLMRVVDEMEQYLEYAAQRAAAEAEEELRRRLEEESLNGTSVQDDSSVSLDPKQARKERREKYAMQRKLDAAKRIEVTKQRKALYELIQNDKITVIFNARAHGSVSEAPGWGQQNDAEMAALNEEMNALTASLAGTANADAAATGAISPNNTAQSSPVVAQVMPS